MTSRFTVTALISLTLVLGGCATTPPPAAPTTTPEQQALMDSVAKIEKVSASLSTAPTPYQGYPLPASPRYMEGVTPTAETSAVSGSTARGLDHVMSAQWSGKASTLLASMAQRIGWTFQDEYKGDESVRVSMTQVKASDILKEVARQLPADAVIRVRDNTIVLK